MEAEFVNAFVGGVGVGVGLGFGPIVGSPNKMNSTGRANVLEAPAPMLAICDPIAAMSVRVSALMVAVCVATNAPAAVAAAVFATRRQRSTAVGTRFGWNRK